MAPLTAAPRFSVAERREPWLWGLVRGGCGLVVVALLVWCLLRAPRGFALLSWGFFEHQLFLSTLALLGASGAVATLLRHPFRYALRDAFWGVPTPLALAVALHGNTEYAAWFAVFVALALALLVLPRALRRTRQLGLARLRYGPFALGVSFGSLFVLATRAPAASTHPVSHELVRPDWLNGLTFGDDSTLDLEADAFHVRLERSGARAEPIAVLVAGRRLVIDPAFELESYSNSGLWTIFDFHRDTLPSWQMGRIDSRSAALRAETELLSVNVLVRIAADGLSVRSLTHVRREVSVHLARALALGIVDGERADLRVEGQRWDIGGSRDEGFGLRSFAPEPVQFLGYRHGRFELLRAKADEKGPFTTLVRLADHDPWLAGRGFRLQVQGFARQASREPSPTAGFGVSQGVIQASSGEIRVELAATAVGRGWNTVRIAPGTYDLTLVVKKQP